MTDPLAEIEQAIATHADGLKHELARLRSLLHLATKEDLQRIEEKIMSVISQFVDRQNAFNDRLDTAIDGVSADVQGLKDLIAQLQNSPGTVTPEDQALLDQLEARVGTAVSKVEALDSLTPPTPPPAVPTNPA